MNKIRSVLFNIMFYGVLTPGVCILLMPSLLMPRRAVLWVATLYQDLTYVLEKYILNLDYEVRGLEYLPQDTGHYLVAAKHHSAYETLKLLRLFKDPTIILKKELLSIPIFGWFLKALGVIAIDRSNREQSVGSLAAGAKQMKENNRPIVIFPQGTRVEVDATTTQKPYKGGIIKLYTATNMPIIPMAINSGVYWPRNSFWKQSGKVVIEFLPPIPAGLPTADVLKMLEEQIEGASNKLITEGRQALLT